MKNFYIAAQAGCLGGFSFHHVPGYPRINSPVVKPLRGPQRVFLHFLGSCHTLQYSSEALRGSTIDFNGLLVLGYHQSIKSRSVASWAHSEAMRTGEPIPGGAAGAGVAWGSPGSRGSLGGGGMSNPRPASGQAGDSR